MKNFCRRTSIFKAICLAGILCCGSPAVHAADPAPYDCASPLVGTDTHGHAYPGAVVPFGMVQLSPDTRTTGWDGCSGYHYSDATIQGFSHTHVSGTGVGALGDFLLMPTVGDVRLEPGTPGKGYASNFSHSQELAQPGYYRVDLLTPQVTAELTATTHVGFHRYTFPATDQAHVVIDLVHNINNEARDAGLTVENDTTLSGFRRSKGWGGERAVYFVAQFSRSFGGFGLEQNGQRLSADARSAAGKRVKAFVDYGTAAGERILVKVGISATSIEGARRNLQAEAPGWDFDAVHAAAAKQWSDALGAIQIETDDPHVRNTFYSNLYLALLAPATFNDADGSYYGQDHRVHPAPGFQNYTELSLWDTHRAEHPLLTLLQPVRAGDMVRTLLTGYQESGLHSTGVWPLWGNETFCMDGYHSVAVITDAYFKGLAIGDPEAAYQAMRDTAMQARDGLDTYRTLGYMASRPGAEAAAKTLEYAFDDWCIARMAAALRHPEDAALFYGRAANYRNLFDRTTHFFRGRRASGAWREPFDTLGMVGDEYTEADAWQYLFAVPQDVPGLVALHGGDAGFVRRMDDLFNETSTIHTDIPDISGLIGQYSQGDEQCHHVAYLYDYAGAPWKTQQRVREVMHTFYSDQPSGQCGNTDCGQMAAWYVLSALGFYEVTPASGVYVLGSPLVNKAVIHLDQPLYQRRTFTVVAEGNSPQNIYVQSARLDGQPLAGPWFTHAQLAAGGELRLAMGPRPNTAWGVGSDARPPATMPADFRYGPLPPPSVAPVPKLPLRIVCGSNEPAGDFEPDAEDSGSIRQDPAAAIDVSAPHAAPEGVYRSARFAHDLRYVLPVPPGQGRSYLVRLHFVELFDDKAGQRVENVAINGRTVLPNFDILAAAGQMRKAVVKEFPAVAPDEGGNITLRFTPAGNSPDRNAKVSGIEVLPMP